jgi:hypothetical protein
MNIYIYSKEGNKVESEQGMKVGSKVRSRGLCSGEIRRNKEIREIREAKGRKTWGSIKLL